MSDYIPPTGTVDLHLGGVYIPPTGTVDLSLGSVLRGVKASSLSPLGQSSPNLCQVVVAEGRSTSPLGISTSTLNNSKVAATGRSDSPLGVSAASLSSPSVSFTSRSASPLGTSTADIQIRTAQATGLSSSPLGTSAALSSVVNPPVILIAITGDSNSPLGTSTAHGQTLTARLIGASPSPLGDSAANIALLSGTAAGSSDSPLGTSSAYLAGLNFSASGSSSTPLGNSRAVAKHRPLLFAIGSSVSPLGDSAAELFRRNKFSLSGSSVSPLSSGDLAVLAYTPPPAKVTAESISPLSTISISRLRQINQDGSGFGFVVVNPLQITPTYSSAALIEIRLWDADECYARGEEVRTADNKTWVAMFDKVEDRLNKCKTLYNIGRNPATAIIPLNTSCMYPYDGYSWWKEIATVENPLLMFDGTLERETVATDTLEVHFVPDTKIDALCIFGITAATVKVTSERYTREDNLEYADPLYPSVKYHDQFIELDFPHEVGDTIKLFFTGLGVNLLHPAGMIRVGMVVAGVKEDLGLACYGTEVGIKDYSQKDRDVFGMPVIREETYSEWVRYDFEAETERLYQIKQIVSKYRAQYVAYIGRDSRPETCVYGMMQDFSIPVETWSVSTGSLEVLGAPLAFHRPYCPVCPPGGGWEEGKTVFCGQTPCDDAEPIPEGEYGLCQTKTVTAVCGNTPNVITGMAEDGDGNVVEVGLNGVLFINDKRTPFSPWYDMNWRCAGFSLHFNRFILAGDDGFIATIDSGSRTVVKRVSPVQDDFISVATSLSVSPINALGPLLTTLLTRCGERIFSFDGGITWLLNEELTGEQGNLFDGKNGISHQNADKVSFAGASVIYTYEDLHCMGRTNGVLHYNDGMNTLWQTARNVPTTETFNGIVSSRTGSRRVILATPSKIIRTTEFNFVWSELANPLDGELIGCHFANGNFYVASSAGQIANLGPCTGESLSVQAVEDAKTGTLAPLRLYSMASGVIETGAPGG